MIRTSESGPADSEPVSIILQQAAGGPDGPYCPSPALAQLGRVGSVLPTGVSIRKEWALDSDVLVEVDPQSKCLGRREIPCRTPKFWSTGFVTRQPGSGAFK